MTIPLKTQVCVLFLCLGVCVCVCGGGGAPSCLIRGVRKHDTETSCVF